jgi:hypothetical protein
MVCSQQVNVPKQKLTRAASKDPWAYEKQQFQDQMAAREAKELGLKSRPKDAQEAWQKLLRGGRRGGGNFGGHYGNEA